MGERYLFWRRCFLFCVLELEYAGRLSTGLCYLGGNCKRMEGSTFMEANKSNV